VPPFNRDAPDAALNGSTPFTCTWKTAQAGGWATLAGELDIAYAPLLDQALREAEASASRVILLDLRELAFIDLSGMRVIAEASERLKRRGRRLILVRGPRGVDMVFALTRSTEQLEIVDPRHAEPADQVLMRVA
jgi:anti-anti-sigma factor